MAEFLAYRIADDKSKFERVPKSLHLSVAECLIVLDAEDKIPKEVLKQLIK